MEDEEGYMALDRRYKRGAAKRPEPLPDAAPTTCPRWHGVLLKLSVLSHVVLLVLVAVLSVQVFQKTPTPPNALQNKSEAGGRTEVCVIPSLLRYFCHWNGSTGHGGCKLCPLYWQLLGDQCYQVSKSSGTWMEGKKDCESRESHLAVLRNTADKDHLSEIIRQDKLTVWIGLKASNYIWKWGDNSSFDATMFGSLGSVENGCVTFRDKKLEVNSCGSDHKWVCQTKPFHLLSNTTGDGDLYGAHPEKPILQDACC